MKIDIDKAKEKLAATAMSAKDLVSKENIGNVSSRIAALKTKEGRDALISQFKAMPTRGKIVLSAVATGLVLVLFGIGSCLFSDNHLDKRLGTGMTRYVMDYQKLQNQLNDAAAKLERGEGKEEPDLIKRHREAIKAAKNIAKYVKETTVPGSATEAGKEVAVLIKDIATVESNLWDRLHHVMPLTADSAEQSPVSDGDDRKRERTTTDVAVYDAISNMSVEDSAKMVDNYRENFGNGAGDWKLTEEFGVNVDSLYQKAGKKKSKYAGMPEELAEKMVKDIEADLDYMASEERYNGQVQRASASYQVKFDSDADRTRGDNYNKLQEYDEFKQNARIAARKQSDELNAKLQKLKSLLATPTGN